MAEETNYPSLQGKRVSTTYGGVLHLPHSLTGTKNIIYDGKGTPTSLTIGGISQGVDVSGDLTAGNITNSGNLSTTGSVSIIGHTVIGGNVGLINGGNINDIVIGDIGSATTLIAPNNAEVGRLKIRDTASDYEIGFGNNLFTIAVKKTGSNNLFVKNNYAAADNLSPLWINKTTGEVTVAALNTGSITNNGNLINKGTVSVDGVATFNSNLTIIGSNTVGGDITMTGGGKINDIEVGAVGAAKTLVSPNNTEVGKLRVRQTAGDYEVLFGDDPTNLFSIIVKKGNGNNLYIKNNYADADVQSPLWIDKATGQVNIKNLNATSITPSSLGNYITKPSTATNGNFLTYNGTDWIASAQTATTNADFIGSNQSLATNGYQKLPGGLIVQWGITAILSNSGGSSGTITYPIAFPSNAAYVNFIGITPATGGSNTNLSLTTKTTTSFSFSNSYSVNMAFNWIAVGY